ncbi:hypothetical protein ABW19_dt0206483 [Dactylella cylindrospora]|nr:hypothetical protein ABW19_dt0206483 [Dactylella cylindrospora]
MGAPPWVRRTAAFLTSKKTKNGKRPPGLDWRSNKWFILATVGFGIFVDILLYSIIVPVVPFALTERANVEESSVQGWISVMLAVYGAGLLVASPVFGYVADHTKYRRAPFLWGLILLAASTAMFAVGNSIAILIVARLIQGMSGGCIWVVGLALVIDTVPAKEQAQSMGVVSIGMTAGSTLGPLFGGVIYEKAGYFAVFILAFCVIGLDIIMRLLVIEKKAAEQWLKEPSQADSLTSGNTNPTGQRVSPKNQDNIRDVMLSTITNVPRRKKSRVPAMILLLKSPRQLNSLLITIMLGTIFSAFDAILPLRVKNSFNFNSTAAGLLFLAIIIPSLFAPLAGRFSDKYGPRWFVVSAFFLCTPLFILLRFPSKPVVGHIVLLCVLLFFIGAFISGSMPGAMGEISASVVEFEKASPGIFGDKGAFAQAYALFNIAWSVGSVVGPLLGGFVNDAVGWNTMVLIFGMLCLLTSMVTVWYTGGKITKNDLPWNLKKKAAEIAAANADSESVEESGLGEKVSDPSHRPTEPTPTGEYISSAAPLTPPSAAVDVKEGTKAATEKVT